MEFLSEFMESYGIELISTALVAIAGYLGMFAKRLVEKYLNDKTAKSIAKTVVQAVQQMYKDMNGAEKLEKAMEAFSDMLEAEDIHISELQMRMLLEASVGEFKEVFKNTTTVESLPEPEQVEAPEEIVEVDEVTDEQVAIDDFEFNGE